MMYLVEYRWWSLVEAVNEDEARQKALLKFSSPDVSDLDVSPYNGGAPTYRTGQKRKQRGGGE